MKRKIRLDCLNTIELYSDMEKFKRNITTKKDYPLDINGAFTWCSTPEKHHYWNKLYNISVWATRISCLSDYEIIIKIKL